ncbi:hypothetical protein LCGC14_1208230 [marine sediment metagenome]|uniref:Uncharacterized protein n=1 Tax=marine sediment metagenome TaxID=412755 RepID=A0A0F9M276_9ZZZZ
MKTAYLSLKRLIIIEAIECDPSLTSILNLGKFLNEDYPVQGTLFPTLELAEKDQESIMYSLKKGIFFIDVTTYNKILTKEILETYVMEQADNIVGTIYPDGD